LLGERVDAPHFRLDDIDIENMEDYFRGDGSDDSSDEDYEGDHDDESSRSSSSMDEDYQDEETDDWSGDEKGEEEDLEESLPTKALRKLTMMERHPPLWELDPKESYSDWTIEVHRQNDKNNNSIAGQQTVDTYHVHRNMLAFGICQSEYFTTLFQSSFVETQSRTSSMMSLAEPAARAFPLFLNLVYQASSMKHAMAMLRDEAINNHDNNSNDSSTSTTSCYNSHLVALLHLADFFQAKQIYRAVKMVIRNRDFLGSNFCHFESLYHQANEFSPPNRGVLVFLEHYFAKNIILLCPPAATPNSPLRSASASSISFPNSMNSFWNNASLDFIIAVVSSERHFIVKKIPYLSTTLYSFKTEHARSLILSDLVAGYCNHNKEANNDDAVITGNIGAAVLNAESFGILTQKDYIPAMTFHAAKLLLQLEKHYHNGAFNDATVNNICHCSCLQGRCLNALLRHHELIDTKTTTNPDSPDYDETLKILGTSTLLSMPCMIKFMNSLHYQQQKQHQQQQQEQQQQQQEQQD
jgi:hypothetical protein